MAPGFGAFDPPIGRQSSVVFLSRRYNESCSDYRLVSTISTRSSTEVIEVNSASGALLYAADHSFTDEASALATLSRQGFMEIARGTAILGFTSTDTQAGVLLATRVTQKAILPGGHVINLVVDARWETLPLDSSPTPFTAALEQDFWRSLQQHTVSGNYYYCETADLTRPFPSSASVSSPEPEFVWNAWLSQPFRDLGLPSHCPVLLQGAVEASHELHPTGQRYTLCLLSRRSRRHPGTRYIARGLNELAGPGNEIEVELLMWTPSAGAVSSSSLSGSGKVQWARIAWRRGTVPIWWGVDLQKGLQAEVYVREEAPYQGTLTYFRSLQRWSAADALGAAATTTAAGAEAQKGSGMLPNPVTCINLLHANPRKAAELMLSSEFQLSIRYVKERLGETGGPPPRLLNFDWHGVMGTLTEERGIEAFWTFIEQPVKDTGLALGVMEPAGNNTVSSNGRANSVPEDVTPWGGKWRMRWLQRQRGLLRFNCADSLDRTNAATCFAVLPALQEGLRLLGIPLDVTSEPASAMLLRSPLRAGAASLPTSASTGKFSVSSGRKEESLLDSAEFEEQEEDEAAETIEEEVLPEGWEKKSHGGRAVYVDHVNKRTQWQPPPGTVVRVVTKIREQQQQHQEEREKEGDSGTGRAEGVGAASSAAAPPPEAATTEPPPPPPPNVAADASSALGPPWAFFNYRRLDDIRVRLYADALADYVTMFRKHGDVHSSLYTGSPAMHSHVLSLVLADNARPYATHASVGKLQNLRVAVQRRYNNIMSDSARQQSMELFLGMNIGKNYQDLTLGAQCSTIQDLSGLDYDDTEESGSSTTPAHEAAVLKTLPMNKHDGRLGLQEDVANLEPLPPPSQGSGGSSRQEESSSRSSEEGVDDEREAFDPLGAIKTTVNGS